MRGIYQSIAIAVASLSLLGAPAYAALTTQQSADLAAAVSAGNAAGVQAIINAAGTDTVALGAIAAALTSPSGPNGTVNTTLLATIAASNGGSNAGLTTALGVAMAANLTPATVQAVLVALLVTNPGAANALGPVIAANGNANMQAAVTASGASTGAGGGGTGAGGGSGGTSSGGTKTGSEQSGQTTDNNPSSS
jgi:hypothetical protein